MNSQQKIIGREAEIETLDRLYDSKKSEFVIVYGRRRVGKTFLISRKFEDKFTFRLTALSKAKTKEQLATFNNYLSLFDP
ncbi:MAG: ATP-binding protein [Bacteroidota bacterium]